MPSTQAKKEMFGKGKRSKQGGKTKKKTVKEQAAKRTAKAPEDDPAFIAPTVLNSTKYGSYAAVVFGGLSALAAVVPSCRR